MKIKPRRPNKVTVLGQTYYVELVGPDDPPIVVNGHTGYGGSHARNEQVIQVTEDGFGPEQEIEVFLHECVHAIVSQGRFVHYLTGDDDEPFVDAFTPQLQDFLRSNPKAVAYVMGRSEL